MRRSWKVALPVLTVVTLTSGCGYNRIQALDEQVNQAKGQIGVQLQRRADLIPNLVETVKGYAQQESTVFVQVADARSRLSGAVAGGQVGEMADADIALTGALGRLLAIAEAYPELKSDQNFRALQDELEGTENRIAVARTDYNESVGQLNAFIRTFPYNLTAMIFRQSSPREYFEANPGAAEAPRVEF